jgi:hypothetical protein
MERCSIMEWNPAMDDASKTREEWLATRAECLAHSRATDLAWAAFRFERGLTPTHWSVCGGGFLRAARREGDAWRVCIMQGPCREASDVAATVIVNDRTGACEVTVNPDFVWGEDAVTDGQPPSTLCPKCGADLTDRPQVQSARNCGGMAGG